MSGRGTNIKLGPFTGGINLAADASAVADEELVSCINFDIDTDGALICRPPIKVTTDMSGTWTERIVALGIAVLGGNTYVIGSNTNGVFHFRNNTWTLITSTFQATSFVQYDNKIWLVAKPGSANPGGSWDGTTFVAVAAMPKGTACVIYKERMWIAPGNLATTNTSRLSFSNIAAPGTWSSSDFFDISPGDGENIVDIIVFANNLLIFKNDSTFTLAYDTRPVDAAVIKISNKIGATTARCVVNYQNSVFIYHEGNIYELVNFNWLHINQKVPFAYDATAPSTRVENVFLSVIGNRLIVRYYNNIYVYNLDMQVWTQWESADTDLHNFGPWVSYPSDATASVNDLYYAGSSIGSNESFLVLADGHDSTTIETGDSGSILISCSITTKNYDLDLPYKYKRLFWWGCEAVTDRDITGIATPVVASFRTTWGDLLAYTWDEMTGTWNNPLQTFSVTTVAESIGGSTLRQFFKFLKTLRYRQINFQVVLETDGSSLEGPTKLYTLRIVTDAKQTVSQEVT